MLRDGIDGNDTRFGAGWEAWETDTFENNQNRQGRLDDGWGLTGRQLHPVKDDDWDPKIRKNDVQPSKQDVYQEIKDRYLGLDSDFTRRWKNKYNHNMELDNLHEIYQQEFAEPSEFAARSAIKNLAQSNSRILEISMASEAQAHGYELPQNKLVKNISKQSLAPSIMPGGALTDVMRSPASRSPSAATQLLPLNRYVSNASLETLLTVADTDNSRRKAVHKHFVKKALTHSKQDGAESAT